MKKNKRTDLFQNYAHPSCYLLKYQFQNGLIKLLFKSDFKPLVLIEYKRTFHVLSVLSLAPYLINERRTKTLQINEHTITQSHVFHILSSTGSPPRFPFSIALYTSFTFYVPYRNKVNRSDLIGWYQGTQSTLHIFLTPSIGTTSIFLTYLDSTVTHKQMTCLKNIYSMPHLTEGVSYSVPKSSPPQPALNQNYCICAHPNTKQFTVPGNHTFKPLGKQNYLFVICIFNFF